ncbi:hypothetical protein O6H91_16G082300 [Diphasiastrum complanatum]|uniref:Uncharacterized protein n=1 Tax=Diphasiastrum complanatum TaxID=34168 RepID=A0ACC2BEB9_DIPCM|nr:hypothetical protein O6H91_16G082300 [Diphasiastrum complanatum]
MAGPVGAGGSSLGKRGRGASNSNSNNNNNPSAAAAAAAAAANSDQTPASGATLVQTTPPSMGPTVQVQSSLVDQNNKRIVMALQSGLKSELAWALNSLTLLSFKEKDDSRKDATPLAKVPGLLDSLLRVIDEWRDVAHVRDSRKLARSRTLGLNRMYTGFGLEYELASPHDPLIRLRSLQDNPALEDALSESEGQKKAVDWWWDEEGLFNLDEVGRAERQQCAVAASNVLRNFSFMPENEVVMAQHRHCLETIVHCMESHDTEDEELVTNAIETMVNLAPYLCLRVFSEQSSGATQGRITEKKALQAVMQMLESPVKAWHCSAAELLGRLIVNPDNEPFILPFAPQVYKRLVDLLSSSGADSQAAAVAALYNFAEINMDCRLRLANERWAVGRLLRVIQAPHPVAEVCRKAALTLESLASEPENRTLLLAYEHSFAELALLDTRMSDTFARILWELSSKSNAKNTARGIWGSY